MDIPAVRPRTDDRPKLNSEKEGRALDRTFVALERRKLKEEYYYMHAPDS